MVLVSEEEEVEEVDESAFEKRIASALGQSRYVLVNCKSIRTPITLTFGLALIMGGSSAPSQGLGLSVVRILLQLTCRTRYWPHTAPSVRI